MKNKTLIMTLTLQRVKQIAAITSPWMLSASSCVLAWHIQNTALRIRWIIGYAASLFGIKVVMGNIFMSQMKQILPKELTNAYTSMWWGMINIWAIMTGVHGLTQIFGGTKYYKKHNIKSIKQALIASMSSNTIYYKNENELEISQNNVFYENIKQLLKYIALFGVGRAVSKYLKSKPDLIYKIENEYHPFIHMEVVCFLLSIAYTTLNIPSYTISIGLGVITGEIRNISKMIPCTDWVYLGNSFRELWKNWSVPAGEMLRYSIYEPLGGRDNVKVSAPALFMFNNTFHWDLSYNMYGYRAIEDWTKVFVLLGLCVTTEIMIETKTEKKYNDTLWYKIGSFAVYHAVLTFGVYIMKRKAFVINVESLCNTFLIDQALQIKL